MAIADWKYKSRTQSAVPRWSWQSWALAGGVVVAGWLIGWGPAGVLPVGIAMLVSARQQNKIIVSNRYLIAGAEIVYFANVSRLVREERRLLLTHLGGQVFVLEADRFPSNARKADKIARHQAEKFSRVADRLLAHVRIAAPGAVMSGQEVG